MSQEPQPAQHHKGISKEVLIAIIGAIATVLAAAIGLLPNLLAGQDPLPDPTPVAVASAPPAPPTTVNGDIATPGAAAQTPVAPATGVNLDAPTPPPAVSGAFPCDAAVSAWNAVDLNVVRDFPNQDAMLREPVKVGAAVRVIDISGTALPWYRIASPDGRVLGWIPAEYLSLAATCPQS